MELLKAGPELARRTGDVAAALRGLGLGPADRVALVMPNGPEMAVALLGTMEAAVAVPLHPDLTAGEFRARLEQVEARLLLVPPDSASPALEAARRLGLRAVEPAAGPRAPVAPRAPGETVLIVFTSGTTARPKAVPLTRANLEASSSAFRAALGLGPADRCLNLVPLYHVQGVVGALLPSLEAGGGVYCTPGFDAGRFPGWLRDLKPSWFTAGPALHRAILASKPGAHALRFLRSVSAPLPPALLAEIEACFGVPVVEGYGMTETGTITSNPLDARRPGSVGVSVGPEIRIVDGEILVRGPSVTQGYLDDPAANTAAFVDGWFRTGDLGRLDSPGYLTITGRVKELINRAGEKVSPGEVEEALLRHPGVAEAVAFPLPHPQLGEDVAAAVVRRPGAAVGEADLRRFAAAWIAVHKVPRRIVFVEAIPRTAGKLRRSALAQTLDVNPDAAGPRPPHVAPEGVVERKLAALWRRHLAVEEVGAHDDFFALGGDSLTAARLFAELDVKLPLSTLLQAPTLRELAAEVEKGAPAWPSRVLVQAGDGRRPFFCVHGLFGNAIAFRRLAETMGPEQTFHGLQARGLDGREAPLERIEDMAARYLEEVVEAQPEGPYRIGGWSFGGLVAFEMARQLKAAGREVALLAILDSRRLLTAKEALPEEPVFVEETAPDVDMPLTQGPAQRLRARFADARKAGLSPFSPEYHARRRIEQASWRALLCYQPRPYAGRLHLLWSTGGRSKGAARALEAWERLAEGGVERVEIPGVHLSVMQEPMIVEVGRLLRSWIGP